MKSYCNQAVCQAPLGIALRLPWVGTKKASDLTAAEVVAVVHHCIYCYTFRNARASTTCARYPGKLGTEGYILSIIEKTKHFY